MGEHRAGYAVLAGRSNVGKSTLLNALCGFRLAIVTPTPQTTRNRILGVVHRPDAQIVWIDTPGMCRPRNELSRRMVSGATAAALEADVVVVVVVFVADAATGPPPPDRRSPERGILDRLAGTCPVVLALNKVDLVHPQRGMPSFDRPHPGLQCAHNRPTRFSIQDTPFQNRH